MRNWTTFALVVLSLAATLSAHAAAPQYVPLQGVLTDPDGVPINGTAVSMRFGLNTLETGGTEVWNETQSITPQDGLFTAYLGQVTTLALSLFRDNGELWLEVKVGSDGPMPRVRLGSGPFAGYAEYCGNVPQSGPPFVAVSHSYMHLVDFGQPVEILGLAVRSGDLIYADCHGAISIPREIAAEIPDVAARIRAKEQRIVQICLSSDFSTERLLNAIRSDQR